MTGILNIQINPIIGNKDAFVYAVNNINVYERKTDLKEKLLSCIK